jgi:hypothetical protein
VLRIKPIPIPDKLKKAMESGIKDAINDALLEAGKDIQKEYKKTVWGWSRKPDFKIQASGKRLGIIKYVDVYPIGKWAKVYGWVDLGTKEHLIPKSPKTGKNWLVFMRGWKARTSPGRIGSGFPSRTPPSAMVRQVSQSIEARRFSETIAENYQREIGKKMSDAIERAVSNIGS